MELRRAHSTTPPDRTALLYVTWATSGASSRASKSGSGSAASMGPRGRARRPPRRYTRPERPNSRKSGAMTSLMRLRSKRISSRHRSASRRSRVSRSSRLSSMRIARPGQDSQTPHPAQRTNSAGQSSPTRGRGSLANGALFARVQSTTGAAAAGVTTTTLELVKKAIVLGMRPDPEPGDVLVFQESESALPEGHADRIDGLPIVHLLEVEARVPGILAEQSIRLAREGSDL